MAKDPPSLGLIQACFRDTSASSMMTSQTPDRPTRAVFSSLYLRPRPGPSSRIKRAAPEFLEPVKVSDRLNLLRFCVDMLNRQYHPMVPRSQLLWRQLRQMAHAHQPNLAFIATRPT